MRSLILRAVTAIAATVVPSAGMAQDRQVAPEAAPPAWVAYAQQAQATITSWLGGEDETALRFRTYWHATRPAADQATAPLVLKVWIEGSGGVARVEFTPFADEQPNADLRATLVGRALPRPPAGMLMPMRLAVQLEAAPPPPPPDSDGSIST